MKIKAVSIKTAINPVTREDVTLPFDGVVSLRMPGFKERLDVVKELQSSEDETATDYVEVAKRQYDLVEKYIESVDLSLGDEKISNLEDLTCYEEGTLMIFELAKCIGNGIPVGKISKPQSS